MNIESIIKDNLRLTIPYPAKLDGYSVRDFDKDGFDLTEIEAIVYEGNNLLITRNRYRRACQLTWDLPSIDPSLVHHSYLLARYGFDGALADQLRETNIVGVNKLLQIKPKLGLDINIEYTFEDGYVIDVLHVETDYQYNDHRCATLFKSGINFWEDNIRSVDWVGIAHELRNVRHEWQHLTGDDENDYKARFVGLDRAYKTYKVI